MHDFEYEAPTSLDAAIELMASRNGSARPMAGGTDLIEHMRIGRHRPELVVDVKKLPELNVLERADDAIRIGAAVPCWRVIESDLVRTHLQALADSCSIIGGVQIQSRASIGGNLCTSGPAADTTPALIAFSAVCVIAGPAGTRKVPVEQFCTGPGTNVLQAGELLQEIRIPIPHENTGTHYRRFIPRNEMDIAVVGVGAAITLNEDLETIIAARIGLGAVAPTALVAEKAAELLIGHPVNDERITQSANAARQIVSPIDDMRGTIEFRTHITGVFVERVVKEAIERAKGKRVSHFHP